MAFTKPRFNLKRLNENVNEGIRAPQVRVIFPDGSNEVLPTHQAIQKAKDLNLDLVMVSPAAKPPVTKIIEYGKWQYEQKKHKQEIKRNQHTIQVKELKFSPNTDDHDYEFKCKHAINFLKDHNKVRAVVNFKGREVAHSNLGIDILIRLVNDLAEFGKAEYPPRQEGKNAFVLIAPLIQH